MSLSSRDIEKLSKASFKEPRFSGFFIGLLRLLAKIPYIRKRINNSPGGYSGRIFYYWEKNDYKKATQIAIYALAQLRNKKSRFIPETDHHYWWQLMKHGVESATHIDEKAPKDKLIALANTGIEPFEGHYVAYSFLEFSRWKYQEGNYEDSYKYAEIASQADTTWAHPEFILGWYALLHGRESAEEYLSLAIERDPRTLFKIANDEICKQYPHIINKLKKKYSESTINTASNTTI